MWDEKVECFMWKSGIHICSPVSKSHQLLSKEFPYEGVSKHKDIEEMLNILSAFNLDWGVWLAFCSGHFATYW